MIKYPKTFIVFSFSISILFHPEVYSEIIPAVCPPVLKMIDSEPGNKATDVSVEAPIIFTWDNEVLQRLSDDIRDLKPVLESVNIAGGRYGMGTLLTTEWGIGGKVSWEDNREVIVPESPLEPGTQYRVWTYHYMTIRNKDVIQCQGIGGEIIFQTAGIPPDDGKPVRDFDLGSLYNGDKFGRAVLQGNVVDILLPIRVLSIKDRKMGALNILVYEGTPIIRNGGMIPLDGLKKGDRAEIKMSGGRVSTVVLLDVE